MNFWGIFWIFKNISGFSQEISGVLIDFWRIFGIYEGFSWHWRIFRDFKINFEGFSGFSKEISGFLKDFWQPDIDFWRIFVTLKDFSGFSKEISGFSKDFTFVFDTGRLLPVVLAVRRRPLPMRRLSLEFNSKLALPPWTEMTSLGSSMPHSRVSSCMIESERLSKPSRMNWALFGCGPAIQLHISCKSVNFSCSGTT